MKIKGLTISLVSESAACRVLLILLYVETSSVRFLGISRYVEVLPVRLLEVSCYVRMLLIRSPSILEFHQYMYSNYCYVNRLPESQLGQFREAIRALSSSTAPSDSLKGYIKADVLAPILSKCEQLSPADWTKLYPLSAQQLGDLNASQASSNQPPLSPDEFLDANSLHLIRDSYLTWVERYKVFFALKKELRSHQIDYPLKIDAFLRFASFGSFLTYKLALGSAKYGDFISDQRQLHIKRMAPTMGPSYRIEFGAFQAFFEEQERQALPVIRRFGSLLSPAYYLPITP
ncbi:hypothetical protein Taro_012348 [Colocasia esculenta]|uniref:Uncharacterized protein n=1 Tax=Colocasia esculenta TaxID=4460 RepID=A0A843U8T8_COLES|nr:hypothetical protein [Colocasia esculenta]